MRHTARRAWLIGARSAMKISAILLLVSAWICGSCFHDNRRPVATMLSDTMVREIARAAAKSAGRDIGRFAITKVDVVSAKGRARWVVMFQMKADVIADSDFWVDVDDQTKRAFVRGSIGLNPDDL